ncbi:hypothetical protein C5167_007638 [Papaver somniferum]|nr:hypothetical protein C5167_007638 [Papaver somniferum]
MVTASYGKVATDSYSTVRGVDKLIPVDVYLPGCPPKPEAVIDAITKLRAIPTLLFYQEGRYCSFNFNASYTLRRSELDHNGISVYTATIISDWGGRSELKIDRKARIWACVSRKQKISILVLSSAMGSNLREILDNVCYPEIFLSFPNDKEKKKIGSKENAILEFYQQFACVGGDPVFSESLCKEFSWLYGSSGGEIELQEIVNGLINTQMYNSPGISIALKFITVGIGFKLSTNY